ncbi:MAG: hypothetical protein KA764_17215 [Anaerolineales bacterium]|nr:hypothetical protein [Anaerolineales bacterium]
MTDTTEPEANRRTLGQELEGLEGLVYRIATTLEPGGLHTASLSVVCEAIYLARQVMANDAVRANDLDNLTAAVDELKHRALEWKITACQAEIWPLLPEHLQPEAGPTRKALEYALHEWLSEADLDGQPADQLARGFAAFCETSAPPATHRRRRG